MISPAHLIAERDPVDAFQQRRFIHARRWGRFQAEHDFRLDARLQVIP
jgi:hypothetical protein